MDALLAAPSSPRKSLPPPASPPLPAAVPASCSPAAVLGLEPEEADPVRIILAAQLRLRRYRRDRRLALTPHEAAETRRIVEARDHLLSRAVGQLAAQLFLVNDESESKASESEGS